MAEGPGMGLPRDRTMPPIPGGADRLAALDAPRLRRLSSNRVPPFSGGGSGSIPTNSRRIRWVLLVVLLLLVSRPIPGVARQAVAEADVTVTAESAVAAFPAGIDFSVEASSPDGIAEAELFWRPAMEETLTLGLPEVEPGPTVELDHRVELRAGALPPGLDVHYRWRFTEADGDVLETPERTVLWEDDRFDWQPLGDGPVVVYSYSGDAAFQADVLASAEETVERLSLRFEAELTDPVRIWVYESDDDLTGALPPNSEPWIAGAAFPWFGLVQAVLPTGDREELARVVPHEISHLVLFQATRNPFNGPPAWLDEGLATLAQGSGQTALWVRLAGAAEAGELDRLRSLNGQFPYDPDGALLAYAQSLSAVQYIVDTYGETGLSKLIAIFREGVSYDEAVERTLGIGLDELDVAWRASVPAQAERELAALGGTTDGGAFGEFDGFLLASGSLIMGVVALVAVFGGARGFVRARRLRREPVVGGWDDGLVVDSRPSFDPVQEQRA
ncbi:MAG TPA: peptidase MA family metallohydrolase [Thermomicrobiales bacterium]|nr:peptidase MA family metallohydrolase [Thermomicrobiales bacterium]